MCVGILLLNSVVIGAVLGGGSGGGFGKGTVQETKSESLVSGTTEKVKLIGSLKMLAKGLVPGVVLDIVMLLLVSEICLLANEPSLAAHLKTMWLVVISNFACLFVKKSISLTDFRYPPLNSVKFTEFSVVNQTIVTRPPLLSRPF
jgi:hypothetical protein